VPSSAGFTTVVVCTSVIAAFGVPIAAADCKQDPPDEPTTTG
jgi:hypothetical protein